MPRIRAWFRPPLTAALALAALAPLPALAASADEPVLEAGSGLRAGSAPWPRWQGRVGLSAPAASWNDPRSSDLSPFGGPGASLRLLGDYYFLQHGVAPASRYSGGFRATGGMIFGDRGAPWSLLPASPSAPGGGFSAERRRFSLWNPLPAADTADGSSPYLGVGYTGLQALTATGGGWGFSADLGVMALRPRSAVRLGQQGLGDLVRELQLSPLLQLGVSYSF